MVSVLVADDHAVVRSGLRQFLASTADLTIAAEAASGREVLDLLRRQACDVLLLDIALPDINGLEVLRRIRIQWPRLPVLIFSMYSEDEFALPALDAGASGFLNKDSPPSEILTALRTVAAGGRYVSAKMTENLLSGRITQGERPRHQVLSRREMQVLIMLSRGDALTDIGKQLHLSVKTISTYRARILEKLELGSNAQLVRYVIEHKLDAVDHRRSNMATALPRA